MPRKRRAPSPTGFYHWICRGIHKKDLFHQKRDFELFRKLLIEYKAAFVVDIYHYCFMKNHVHMLISCPTVEQMAKFSQLLQRRYAYYYCGSHKWVGNVFQRGYRSFPIDKESYLLECGRYIERNPVKANVVQNPWEYPYSSYLFYAMGKEDDLLTASPAYLGLAEREEGRMAVYSEYVTESRTYEEMAMTGRLPF